MAVGGTKDTNIVDSESPYRGTNQRGRSQSSRYVVSWDWLGTTGDSLRISPV